VGDYEADTRVRVTAQQLFDYVSDTGNIPKFLPSVSAVQPTGEASVHVSGTLGGGEVIERDVELAVDNDNHTLTWSSGRHGYRGHLTVVGYGINSGLAVTVSSEHGDPRQIKQGVEEAVATIKKQLEELYPRPVFDPAWGENHTEQLD